MRVDNITPLALLNFKAKAPNGKKSNKKIVKLPVEYKTHTEIDSKALEKKAQREKGFLGINIVKPVNAIIPTKRAGTFSMMIYPDTIRKFLSDEKGKNENYIDKFVAIFTKVVSQIESQYEYDEIEPEVVQDEEDIEPITIALSLTDEEEQALEEKVGVKIDDPEFINILVNKILGTSVIPSQANLYFETHPKETFELDDELIDDMAKRAYRAAIGFFELSKTDTGYDFSFEDEKLRLLSLAERLEYRYGSIVLDDLINNSAKDDGSIDYEFACEVAQIIEQSDMDTSVKKTADTYRRFISGDYEQKDNILKALICTNMGIFALVDEDREFDEVFSLCFDKDKRFSKAQFDAIYEIDEAAEAWLEEVQPTNNEFPFYRNFIKLMMKEYIEKNTDEKGVFIGSGKEARSYFEKAKKPYILKN